MAIDIIEEWALTTGLFMLLFCEDLEDGFTCFEYAYELNDGTYEQSENHYQSEWEATISGMEAMRAAAGAFGRPKPQD